MQRFYDWLRERPTVVDRFIAGCCLLFGLVVAALFVSSGDSLGALFGVLVCVPLAWRRSRTVLAGHATAAIGLYALAVSDFPPPSGLPAGVLMAYTMAAYAPRLHARLALWLCGAAGVVVGVRLLLDSVTTPPGTRLFQALLVGVACSAPLVVAWLYGDVVRARQAYLQEALDRAERLEREREALARVAVVEERARIAREMHDVVAHGMTVMVLQADGAAYMLDTDPQRAGAALAAISRTGRESLAEMRRLLGLLRTDGTLSGGAPAAVLAGAAGELGRARPGAAAPELATPEPATPELTAARELTAGPGPGSGPEPGAGEAPDGGGAAGPVLAPQPGLDRIDELVDQIRAAGLTVWLEADPAPGPVPAGIGLSAYRIVQEALTNTLKHGGPRATAWVRLVYGGDGMEIHVADDGRGAAAPSDGQGHGMIGMRERVTALRGQLIAGPRPGGGYMVSARLPFRVAER